MILTNRSRFPVCVHVRGKKAHDKPSPLFSCSPAVPLVLFRQFSRSLGAAWRTPETLVSECFSLFTTPYAALKNASFCGVKSLYQRQNKTDSMWIPTTFQSTLCSRSLEQTFFLADIALVLRRAPPSKGKKRVRESLLPGWRTK